MGNKAPKISKDAIIYKNYETLINLGYDENLCMKAVTKHPTNIEKAIDSILSPEPGYFFATDLLPFAYRSFFKVENVIHFSARGDYPTIMGNFRLFTGRFYYEIILKVAQCGQFGFGLHSQNLSSEKGIGTGDDSKGWAYDGDRAMKWHKDSFNYGKKWKTGDVIGAAIDIDQKIITFYLNGENMGIAFKNFDIGNGITPSCTISQGGELIIVFDEQHFNHDIPFGYKPFPMETLRKQRHMLRDIVSFGYCFNIKSIQQALVATNYTTNEAAIQYLIKTEIINTNNIILSSDIQELKADELFLDSL
eukprot:342169_1